MGLRGYYSKRPRHDIIVRANMRLRWSLNLHKRKMWMISRARPCLAAILLCLALPGAAFALEVTPHKAIYDMALRSGGSGDIADVRGTMEFKWADSCDGWTVDQRSVMTFLYNTGDEVDLGWNLVSWESKDGLRYRFYVRKFQNGEMYEELRGDARLDGAGKTGIAKYTLPSPKQVDLPAGTLFPTAHSLALLEAAAAGSPFLWANVFDGSDEAGLFGVGAVIVEREEPAKPAADRPALLSAGPSWHVSLAFFSAVGQGAVPEHEQRLRLHANGVVEDLVLDYGDFSVGATLKRVEKLPPSGC